VKHKERIMKKEVERNVEELKIFLENELDDKSIKDKLIYLAKLILSEKEKSFNEGKLQGLRLLRICKYENEIKERVKIKKLHDKYCPSTANAFTERLNKLIKE
jgi:hypothetical protein